ncbi:MAG: hypothetical protein OXM02_00795 [Bacteroidota bacterium]|nr:hypothetical protein [Bacteroidota bacterium]
MKMLVGAAVAFLLHWVLGWVWAILAGILMGVWTDRRGWLFGGVAVGVSWGVLITYTLAVDPGAAGRMFDIMGSIFGGLPGLAVPAVTLLMGVLLGVAGGLFGTGVRNLWQ